MSNRTVYVVMGINMEGERDILGLWVGPTGGESPKFWLSVFTELKNRGVADELVLCCDGLKGLPESARATWPLVDVQLCVVHLVRNSLRFASKKHWGQATKQLKAIYTAPGLDAAETAFEVFVEEWEAVYPHGRPLGEPVVALQPCSRPTRSPCAMGRRRQHRVRHDRRRNAIPGIPLRSVPARDLDARSTQQ